MRLHVAQERGGARAGAFPVVERLRLALRARAGASLCSCVWAGGNVTGSAVNGSERHLCQSRTRDANVPIQCTERAGGASTVGLVCATSASAWTLGWEAVSDRCGSLCSGLIITVYLTMMPHNYAFSTLLGCCVCSKWFQALDKNTDLVNVVTCDCGLSMTRERARVCVCWSGQWCSHTGPDHRHKSSTLFYSRRLQKLLRNSNHFFTALQWATSLLLWQL